MDGWIDVGMEGEKQEEWSEGERGGSKMVSWGAHRQAVGEYTGRGESPMTMVPAMDSPTPSDQSSAT
eukprot:6213067-Pleurochrysis_carterae.AAC.2